MSWEICLSWYLAGAVFGLTIAQFLIKDDVLSWGILTISLGLIVANLCILLWVIIKNRKEINEDIKSN